MKNLKFDKAYGGLWYNVSYNSEVIYHLFRIGTTRFADHKKYEVIIWKWKISWAKNLK